MTTLTLCAYGEYLYRVWIDIADLEGEASDSQRELFDAFLKHRLECKGDDKGVVCDKPKETEYASITN